MLYLRFFLILYILPHKSKSIITYISEMITQLAHRRGIWSRNKGSGRSGIWNKYRWPNQEHFSWPLSYLPKPNSVFKIPLMQSPCQKPHLQQMPHGTDALCFVFHLIAQLGATWIHIVAHTFFIYFIFGFFFLNCCHRHQPRSKMALWVRITLEVFSIQF